MCTVHLHFDIQRVHVYTMCMYIQCSIFVEAVLRPSKLNIPLKDSTSVMDIINWFIQVCVITVWKVNQHSGDKNKPYNVVNLSHCVMHCCLTRDLWTISTLLICITDKNSTMDWLPQGSGGHIGSGGHNGQVVTCGTQWTGNQVVTMVIWTTTVMRVTMVRWPKWSSGRNGQLTKDVKRPKWSSVDNGQ